MGLIYAATNMLLWSKSPHSRFYIEQTDMCNIYHETSSNGNIFRVTGFCAGKSPVTGQFPSQRPVTRSFNVFFDLRLTKRLSNNRDAGDLRHHRTHYDVTVMHKVLEKHTGTLYIYQSTRVNITSNPLWRSQNVWLVFVIFIWKWVQRVVYITNIIKWETVFWKMYESYHVLLCMK